MALKILLADDSMTAQNMGKKILVENGYEVITVSNGAAAMKKLASEKPDAAILDIYMPGYSGLEVCEKIRKEAATAAMPVLLTVGKMENYEPSDVNRVKADGVMIKPFEASDLLAAIQKFQEKLHPPAAETPDYEKTIKMKAQPVEEFQDTSYEEWKAEAPALPKIELPPDMPAFGMDEMMGEPAPAPAAPAPEPAPGFGELMTEAAPVESAPAAVETPHEVEFTSAPQAGKVEVSTAPELELTRAPEPSEVVITRDPALVTDPSEMMQFATKVGAEGGGDDIVVGIAATEPAMQAVLPPVEEAAPEVLEEVEEAAPPVVEQPPVVAAEPKAPDTVRTQPLPAVQEPAPIVERAPDASLEAEMHQAFTPAAAEPAPPPPVEPPPVETAAAAAGVPDRLVAEFEAALQQAPEATPEPIEPLPPPPAPAAAPQADVHGQRLAQAIDRVLQRKRQEIVDEILREMKEP